MQGRGIRIQRPCGSAAAEARFAAALRRVTCDAPAALMHTAQQLDPAALRDGLARLRADRGRPTGGAALWAGRGDCATPSRPRPPTRGTQFAAGAADGRATVEPMRECVIPANTRRIYLHLTDTGPQCSTMAAGADALVERGAGWLRIWPRRTQALTLRLAPGSDTESDLHINLDADSGYFLLLDGMGIEGPGYTAVVRDPTATAQWQSAATAAAEDAAGPATSLLADVSTLLEYERALAEVALAAYATRTPAFGHTLLKWSQLNIAPPITECALTILQATQHFPLDAGYRDIPATDLIAAWAHATDGELYAFLESVVASGHVGLVPQLQLLLADTGAELDHRASAAVSLLHMVTDDEMRATCPDLVTLGWEPAAWLPLLEAVPDLIPVVADAAARVGAAIPALGALARALEASPTVQIVRLSPHDRDQLDRLAHALGVSSIALWNGELPPAPDLTAYVGECFGTSPLNAVRLCDFIAATLPRPEVVLPYLRDALARVAKSRPRDHLLHLMKHILRSIHLVSPYRAAYHHGDAAAFRTVADAARAGENFAINIVYTVLAVEDHPLHAEAQRVSAELVLAGHPVARAMSSQLAAMQAFTRAVAGQLSQRELRAKLRAMATQARPPKPRDDDVQ